MESEQDIEQDIEQLKSKRWATGKEAVKFIQLLAFHQSKCAQVSNRGGRFRHLTCTRASSGCTWSVRLARLRASGDWHVTSATLEHINCVGTAKPRRDQLEAHPVLRSALAADPSASAQALVTQLRDQVGVAAAVHTMYRAKEVVVAEMYSEDPTTIRFLPSFLTEFQRLNPGTFMEVERDTDGRFRRAILILKPEWFLLGQGVYGIDAAHMKHRRYNGVQIVLVGRDGNFANQIVAVALAPVEDYDSYRWFFGHVVRHGFRLDTFPVFSDRNTGLISAANDLAVANMYCVRHIIGNMRADRKVRLTVSQEGHVWAANSASTKEDFDKAMTKLSSVNRAAGEYLGAIPPEKWTLYPHYTHRLLFGWRTTNFVESEQAKSLRLKPCWMLPYEFFKSYATILMREVYERQRQCQQWVHAGRAFTPRAEKKFQLQLKQSEEYRVVPSSDCVVFVSRVAKPLQQRRISVDTPSCSCATWMQLKIPCRHVLAALKSHGELPPPASMAADCYKVATFAETVGVLEIPEDVNIAPDSMLLPAPYIRQAGRPKKKRIRSRGETSERVRKVYKCGRCGKADGHNRATCRQSEK